MIKVNVSDLVQDQFYAQDRLYEANNYKGAWEQDLESTDAERSIDEYDRQEEIMICEDRLKPMSLEKVHLPQLAMVRYIGKDEQHPFEKNKIYVCLGELAQMPIHIVILDYETGKIYTGYHTFDFEIIPVNKV